MSFIYYDYYHSYIIYVSISSISSLAGFPFLQNDVICFQQSCSLVRRSRRTICHRLVVPSVFEEISLLEAQWVAQRAALRCLALQHPEWTCPQLAAAIGCSVSFVNKWLKRFREADPDDLQVLFSRSRARHTPPAPDLRLVQRIIEIRTAPPENLRRTPGPRAILSYLHPDAELAAQGIVPPHSPRTIWKILRKLGDILDPVSIPKVIPLFPLPNLVMFPHVMLNWACAATIERREASAEASLPRDFMFRYSANAIPMTTAMIASTIISSINVKPRSRGATSAS